MIFTVCTEESETQTLIHYSHTKPLNGRQNSRWPPKVDKLGLGWDPKWTK